MEGDENEGNEKEDDVKKAHRKLKRMVLNKLHDTARSQYNESEETEDS